MTVLSLFLHRIYLWILTSYFTQENFCLWRNCLIRLMEFYNFFTGANGVTSTDNAKKDFTEFPVCFDYIWVLGKKFHPLHDLEDLRSTIRSKIWCSYRSGFPAIGGTGPKSDKYWGCMLRCGQMVMAEALIRRHLGKDWVWKPGVMDPNYSEILCMFQDRKDCPYSIHQIAQMGVSEGKNVGQWFGPNTIAQVLRKLSVYDQWSNIAVQVALNSTVIKSDIRTLCKYQPEPIMDSPFTKSYQTTWYADRECDARRCPRWQRISSTVDQATTSWRPMLLFIPLRLGLANLNPLYSSGIKNAFTIRQSLGILGGRPRHAVWFIGYTGEELICIDPHIVQSSIDLDRKFDDRSYHLPVGGSKRMPLSDIDPSIALCFYIESEEDLVDWCQQINNIFESEKNPLFEVLDQRPQHWPSLDPRPDLNCSNCSMGLVEEQGWGIVTWLQPPQYLREVFEGETLTSIANTMTSCTIQ